jgi:hypothetical protein
MRATPMHQKLIRKDVQIDVLPGIRRHSEGRQTTFGRLEEGIPAATKQCHLNCPRISQWDVIEVKDVLFREKGWIVMYVELWHCLHLT